MCRSGVQVVREDRLLINDVIKLLPCLFPASTMTKLLGGSLGSRQRVKQGGPTRRYSCPSAAGARASSHVNRECDLTLLLGSGLSSGDSGQALKYRVENSHQLRGHVLVSACSQVTVETGTDNALQEQQRELRICRPWHVPC